MSPYPTKKIDKDNDGSELVDYIIKKYNENKGYIPVRNISINIETKKNKYKLIRLNDEQFYLLHKNSIAIFEDYGHLISLFADKNIIYSSLSKMYTALKILFGESSKCYDDWKGSFSFPFLIHFYNSEEEFEYLMDLRNIRSSIEFGITKLINVDDKFKRDILHNPFEEFAREEINYFINYCIGFLTGFFKSIADRYNDDFFKIVESNLILFGYKDGCFFDDQYNDENEFDEAIQKLKKIIIYQ